MSRRALWITLFCAVVTGRAESAGVVVTTRAAAEGSLGLEVLFGPDCGSAQYLELDAADGPLQGTYEACRTISAGSVSVATGPATLRAGDEISLDEGFEVATGASLELVLDSSLSGGPTYVQDTSPIDETVYTARFSARLDDLVLGAGESVGTLVGYSSDWYELFRISVEPAAGGGHQFVLEARLDGGGMVQTPTGQEIAIQPDWNVVEVAWSSGAGDGQLLVGLNGGALSGLADLDNAAARIESIRWGAVDGSVFTAAGTVHLDTYSSTR